jgi:hypothetical protein
MKVIFAVLLCLSASGCSVVESMGEYNRRQAMKDSTGADTCTGPNGTWCYAHGKRHQ